MNISYQYINCNKSVRNCSIKYIVIHSTGNTNDTAQNNHDYFASGNRNASADWFIDDDSAINIIDSDNYYSWAVGDGHGAYGISNSNSISIEMCGTDNGNISDMTINNTVEIVKMLQSKYGISNDNIKRHYDASFKNCPSQFSSNNWARWYDFKDKLIKDNNIIQGLWNLSNNGKWWFKYSDGTYPKDCWIKLPKGNSNSTLTWFLFDTDGYMKTMWQSDCGEWYQLGEDGDMKIGWYYDKKLCNWYYLKEDGSMSTGWIQDNNNWYYMDESGAMQTGWLQKDGFYYLLYSDGSMACNTTAYGYNFDANGHATKIN